MREDLRDGVHVGLFEVALLQLAEAFIARRAVDGRARRRGLEEEVVAHGFEPGAVDEPRELELAQRLRLGLARNRRLHGTGRADLHAAGVLRHGDARIDEVAVARDELSLGVEIEGTVARIGGAAVGQTDLEEAVALHGNVVFLLGRRDVAAGHHPRGAGGLHAGTDFDGRGHLRVLVRRDRTGAAHVLVEEVLEVGLLALVASRPHVRDVVGDDLDVQLLGHHAGRGGV